MEAITTPAPAITRKEYNINRPTPFTGDRNEIENFVQECDVYLTLNKYIYDDENAKVAFTLSFLTAGEAKKWKEQFIQACMTNGEITFPTYAVFMTRLQAAFKAVNPIESAM